MLRGLEQVWEPGCGLTSVNQVLLKASLGDLWGRKAEFSEEGVSREWGIYNQNELYTRMKLSENFLRFKMVGYIFTHLNMPPPMHTHTYRA